MHGGRAPSLRWSSLSAGLAYLLEQLQLRGGLRQLRQRLGLVDLVDLAGECLFRALLGREGRGFIDVTGAQCGIGQHCDAVGLHFECAATDEYGLLAVGGALTR